MKRKHGKKDQTEMMSKKLMCGIYGALNFLAGAAHAVAFRFGWHDEDRTHGQVAASMTQGISSFYTVMENIPAEERHYQHKGWSLTKDGRPVGPAIPLAGVVLNIADYFSAMGWDLGGAVLVQLHRKAKQAEEKQKAEVAEAARELKRK